MADKPLPTAEGELLLFMQNMTIKLPIYAGVLGLSNADIVPLTDDTANFQYLITVTTQVNDSRDAFFAFKDDIINGEISGIVPPAPSFPSVGTPNSATPGIKKRLRLLIKRIKGSPGYTEQIGEDLGLVENGPNPIAPTDVVPEFKLKALNGSKVEITFSKKGFDAMRVEYQRKTEVGWQFAGVFTSSPAIHELLPAVPGDPENREYRGILVEKNVPVTQYSPTYNIVTTP